MDRKAKIKKQPSIYPIFLPKIRLSPDVEFMRKLNERWEDEYRRWLVKTKRIEKILGKGTLIIGARVRDGVILASDRKVIRGGELI